VPRHVVEEAFALKTRRTQGPSMMRLASIIRRIVVSPSQSLEQKAAKLCSPNLLIASLTRLASN